MKQILRALKDYWFNNPKYIRKNIPFADFFVCYKLMEDNAWLNKKDAMKEIYDFYNMQVNEEYIEKQFDEIIEKTRQEDENDLRNERDYYSY